MLMYDVIELIMYVYELFYVVQWHMISRLMRVKYVF